MRQASILLTGSPVLWNEKDNVKDRKILEKQIAQSDKKSKKSWFNFCTSDSTANRDISFKVSRHQPKSALKSKIVDHDQFADASFETDPIDNLDKV